MMEQIVQAVMVAEIAGLSGQNLPSIRLNVLFPPRSKSLDILLNVCIFKAMTHDTLIIICIILNNV